MFIPTPSGRELERSRSGPGINARMFRLLSEVGARNVAPRCYGPLRNVSRKLFVHSLIVDPFSGVRQTPFFFDQSPFRDTGRQVLRSFSFCSRARCCRLPEGRPHKIAWPNSKFSFTSSETQKHRFRYLSEASCGFSPWHRIFHLANATPFPVA